VNMCDDIDELKERMADLEAARLSIEYKSDKTFLIIYSLLIVIFISNVVSSANSYINGKDGAMVGFCINCVAVYMYYYLIRLYNKRIKENKDKPEIQEYEMNRLIIKDLSKYIGYKIDKINKCKICIDAKDGDIVVCSRRGNIIIDLGNNYSQRINKFSLADPDCFDRVKEKIEELRNE